MDGMKKRSVLQGALKVLSQKEERGLQEKLNLLEKQFRHTRMMLQQRRRSLGHEERRVVMVKVCEPKATVNVAMRDIQEQTTTRVGRYICTSDGRRRQRASKSSYVTSAAAEQSRSISAPQGPVVPVRHGGNLQENLSLMKMKNIAAIDSISEKEVARQQQRAEEELKLLRQLQREALHRRVTAFIERLQDQHEEPPESRASMTGPYSDKNTSSSVFST